MHTVTERIKYAERFVAYSGIIGMAGLIVSLVLFGRYPDALLRGLWFASLFWLGFPLGALTILMIHNLTGGAWGEAIRPALRAMLGTMPLALIFLAILVFDLSAIFPWAGVRANTLPEAVQSKAAYLNVPFFTVRSATYAGIWLLLTYIFTSSSGRSRAASAIGLVLQAFTITFFAVDWMMSLEPEFYSTVYGMIEASAETVGAFSLVLLALAASTRFPHGNGGSGEIVLGEDLANMLFGFVLTWVYLSFVQWLIIWAGDLPDEIGWYLARSHGIWLYVLWLLVLCGFAIPFVGFLSRRLKRSPRGFGLLVSIVLLGHLLDMLWRIGAALMPISPSLLVGGAVAFAATGAIWIALFAHLLNGQALPRSGREAHA
jgi:hypothetical protein